MNRRRAIPDGIRITKVGLWYVLFALVVGVAATNTGNNALYMVLSVMLSVLAVSGVVSRSNLKGLGVEVEPPGEIFANTPAALHFNLTNDSWIPRWLLVFSLDRDAAPALIPQLPSRGRCRGTLEMLVARRGRTRIEHTQMRSLFPLGLFRKGLRYSVALDLLVYPELFPAASCQLDQEGNFGEEPNRRAGWGHDLHALRGFRSGDDPRGIHWKQTARTGKLIYREREMEENRRLSILLDNAVGQLRDAETKQRFERLVSEAATAAVDYLERGYEVELVTRTKAVPFGGGVRQRLAVLEALALLETVDPVTTVTTRSRSRHPLVTSDARAPQLRLVLEEAEEYPQGNPGTSSTRDSASDGASGAGGGS